MPLTPVLSKRWGEPESWTLAGYERLDGYRALRAALAMDPDAIIQTVKDSGLLGRGGALFPTGMKWGFIPQGDGRPHYLTVNADEGEPETCKDTPLIMADPHSLVEGVIITCYAVRASPAFVYIRGEIVHAVRRLRAAVAEAYAAGYLGKDILGSGFDLELVVHCGAGSYECGEETALLSSLEGHRGQPKLKPPFPATHGLYGQPTVINNVETIASIPYIVLGGADWWRSMGTERSTGPKLFQISGHVRRPGVYEMSLGSTFRELLELAGGVPDGKQVKAWQPGGASCTIIRGEHVDVPLDVAGLREVGSTLGTAGVLVMDSDTCIVRVVLRLIEFYADESCGKCTPCREGTFWLSRIMERMEAGEGTAEDVQTLLDTCANIAGRSFCALGDAATMSIVSSIQRFRDEYDAHIAARGCPYPGDRTLVGAH